MVEYPSEWLAADDDPRRTGVAKYYVNGQEFVLMLDSFRAYRTISKMLSAADKNGREYVQERAESLLSEAIEKIRERE